MIDCLLVLWSMITCVIKLPPFAININFSSFGPYLYSVIVRLVSCPLSMTFNRQEYRPLKFRVSKYCVNAWRYQRRSNIRTHFERTMCIADYLSPICKILSATCEVAIKLRNIVLQQVRWKKKMALAHACCEFDFFCLLGHSPASIDSEWGYRNGLVSVIYLVAFLTNDLSG